jgi:hypothetical protein
VFYTLIFFSTGVGYRIWPNRVSELCSLKAGELKELREREHETRKASIIAVLAVEESVAEIVTSCNSG